MRANALWLHTPLDLLGALPPDRQVAALPTADIHLHQEWSPRLDRVLARRERRPPYDWQAWAHDLMANAPPGMARLTRFAQVFSRGVFTRPPTTMKETTTR
jgi:hypothetical protein